jgi:hypothetical protein
MLTLLGGGTTSSDDRLDLVRVDESGNVGRRDLGGGEPTSVIRAISISERLEDNLSTAQTYS